MRWTLIIIACLSLPALGTKLKDNSDLTQFDQPFLLGDWYLINPNMENPTENFRAVKLSLDSNYNFSIDIQKLDYSVDHWEGLYTANDETLILGVNSSDPQAYQYESNHNMLNLNGITFTKALPNSLAGIWASAHLSGQDVESSKLNSVDLILQPDFVFMFRVSNTNGTEAIHQGVYYTEGDHLVLLYEDGEHDTRYTLNRDTLTLELEEGDVYAVLNRIK
ncbi:hypothetical protein SAMN04488136_10580 [Vibrio xiamenensis]|uniref:WD40 repeat protein n=1 Tax=Vibrio xiamenensis TaxID=861298 RepID=A0A1G7YEM7_9VIBR|nr:hypothetical protein [Vibrio xiamenensis]SDG94795.1 hypothetical protein SAMN04488136_10580 [Vibrio xiamenensis]